MEQPGGRVPGLPRLFEEEAQRRGGCVRRNALLQQYGLTVDFPVPAMPFSQNIVFSTGILRPACNLVEKVNTCPGMAVWVVLVCMRVECRPLCRSVLVGAW